MPAQPQPRRGLRSYLQCGTQSPEWDWSYLDADGVYTGHGNWQFEEHVFTPIVGQPLAEVFFHARTSLAAPSRSRYGVCNCLLQITCVGSCRSSALELVVDVLTPRNYERRTGVDV